MNPNKKVRNGDPLTTMKAHRSTLLKIQELRARFGYRSGEKMLLAAMNLLEQREGCENGGRS